MPHQAKANLSALIESTKDLIWSVDLDYRLNAFNHATREHVFNTFGVRIEAGMLLHELLAPDKRALWLRFYERVLREGSFRVEYPLTTLHVMELSFNPMMANGKAMGISIFGKDITECKHAEQSLRETDAFLTQAQKIGNLGCYVLDIPSNVFTSSDVMDEIFGVNKDYPHTVEGWAALIHPRDRAMMADYFHNEVIGRRQEFDKEYCIVRDSDRTERWVHGTGKLELGAQGQPLKMHGIIKDITEHKVFELRVRDSMEHYRAIFHTAPDPVVLSRLDDGVIIDANQAFLDLIGSERSLVIGYAATELGMWVNACDEQTMVDRLLRHHSCRELEVQSQKKNGEIYHARVSASLIEISGVRCALVFSRDITEAKAAEERLAVATEALRVSEARYRNVFQTSLDCIVLSSLAGGIIVDVNQAFLDLMGFDYGEVIGKTSGALKMWESPEIRHGLSEMIRRDKSFRDVTARVRKKNGELFWALLSASSIDLDSIPHLLWVVRDISAAKAAEEQIRDLAFYDPLTRLPNRRLLMERLRQSLVSGARTNRKRALLFIDLDNFKTLNDTLGHKTGDLMLREVAMRLTGCIRESDTVARLGGDEFIVMLEELSDVAEVAAAQAEAIGEKILAAIARPFWLSGREYLSTSSMGITVFGDKRESTDEVLQQADIAMYQAKGAGRNTMRIFAPALQAAVNARAALEEEIRQAIKARQFELYYQPQLDNIGLVGAEALVRWNHPRRGLLLPGEFIHLAEETGLILPLGDWVFQSACAQVALWAERPESAAIALSVNISARQFRQSDFVGKILSALDSTGANPQQINLELTESMLVENIEDVIAKMTELRLHGLNFSLDDFGTGYSSLAYLKRLPIDQLKIDSSFVRDIHTDAGSRAIAQSVISLGRALGLSVIAECVETEEQRDLLSRIGCHAFQGFLFSPPVPLLEFENQWLCRSGVALLPIVS